MQQLLDAGFSKDEIQEIEQSVKTTVQNDFEKAQQAEDPKPEDLFTHDFAPTPITEEIGERNPTRDEKVVMVDCALFAVEELMKKHKTSKKEVESALDDGEKIEMEHMKNSGSVADKKEARQIASHHIDERLDYYKLLNKVEKAK
jgi:hypothetical protein